MLKTHQDRNQLQMMSYEAAVDKNSIVRVIDVFVDLLDLKEIGFIIKGQIKNGAPAFHAADLLKLYYYGYSNRVRSSRRLQRETITNLEAIWLIKGCRPSYKTIADFRKNNPKALEKVFKIFNRFLLEQDLFDTKAVAIDGSKFQGQNSTKNNYNEKKVKQHLDHIEKKTQQYLNEMDRLDQVEKETEIELEQRIEISQKLDHLQRRKTKYDDLEQKVKAAREEGQTQFSAIDPDARALPKRMNVVQVGYNIVTAADLKNKLITNFKVANQLDTYLLADLAKDARVVLQKKEDEKLTVLADKGFDTGSELKACAENNITTIVAVKKRLSNKKNKAFAKNKFYFDEDRNEYRCPENHPLKTNGTWYKRKAYNQHRAEYKFQRYTCSHTICGACPYKIDCVGAPLKQRRGRFIDRSESESYVEENTERYHLNKALYQKRQATVEHQFGIIKRQWGFDYTLLKTKKKVTGEFAIIFTCFNLRRSMSILGIAELVKRLKAAFLFVNVMLWQILKNSKPSFQIIKNNHFTFSKN
ncbi:MAG: IS1182 family transposase [Saprospiraceae bacterium]